MPAANGWETLVSLLGTWWLNYWIHSTVLVGTCWILARKRLPLEYHDALWKAALVGGIVTATWATVLPGGPGVAWQAPQVTAPLLHVAAAPNAPLPLDTPVMLGLVPAYLNATPAAPPVSWTKQAATLAVQVLPLMFGLWLAGAAWGLARVRRARRRLHAALAARRDVAPGPMAQALRGIQDRAGFRRPVRLSQSERLGGPVALNHREICVPSRAVRELSPDEQESVLAHEMAHVVRRDPAWLALALAIEAVLFLQPLNRLARRRLQETAEYLCDDWAVRHTGRELTLARCLAQVAGWLSQSVPQPEPAMAVARSPLVRRVERLLGTRPVTRVPAWAPVALVLAVVLGVRGLAPQVVAQPKATSPASDLLAVSEPPHLIYLATSPAVLRVPVTAPTERPEGNRLVLRARDGRTVTINLDDLMERQEAGLRALAAQQRQLEREIVRQQRRLELRLRLEEVRRERIRLRTVCEPPAEPRRALDPNVWS